MANETQEADQSLSSTTPAQDAPQSAVTAPQPQASEQAPASASAAPSGAGTTGSSAPAGQAAPPAGAPTTSASSWRDNLKQAGIDLSGFQDERAATQYLAQQLRQAAEAQQLARYGQEVAPHYQEFQGWLKNKEAQEQAAKEAQKPWWSKYWQPPEYDHSWQQLVVQDPTTGEMKPAPGAPADIVSRLTNYRHFRAQQAERFMQNPYEFIEEPVKQLAQQIAEEAIQKHLGTYQEQQGAQQFVSQHQSWLYAHDAQGQVQRDPLSKEPMLSEWGQKFKEAVGEAQQMGITNLDHQKTFALQRVQLEHATTQLAAKTQTPAAAVPPAPTPNAREAANAAVTGRIPSRRTPAPNNVQPPQPSGQLSLQEKIRRNFKAAGVTDESLQQRA